MAVLIDSPIRRHGVIATDNIFHDIDTWGGRTAAQVLAGTTSMYPQLYLAPVTAEHIRHLLRQHMVNDWHSEPAVVVGPTRTNRHRIMLGGGENTPQVDILGWCHSMQGDVATSTVGHEGYSQEVSMPGRDEAETVDLWADMREDVGSRTADEEPVSETIERIWEENGEIPVELNGEDEGDWWSAVDGVNNQGISGPGMRIISYASPSRRKDSFGL